MDATTDVNDTYDELDAAMASKKRGRDIALTEQELQDLEDKVCLLTWVNIEVAELIDFILCCTPRVRKIEATTDAVAAIYQRKATYVLSSPDTSAVIK